MLSRIFCQHQFSRVGTEAQVGKIVNKIQHFGNFCDKSHILDMKLLIFDKLLV